MKKLAVFWPFLLFFSCVAVRPTVVDKFAVKKKINTLLVAWHNAATITNFNSYFETLDSNAVFIGTAAEEVWTKKQFAQFSKPYFEKGKAWSFLTLERNVYVSTSGDFAWFNELLETWMGTCRGSGVLEKKGNTWRIKQYVLSVPIPNDDMQAVIKAKEKNDAIFLKRYD
jgi:hypothetical protein